MGLTSPVGPQTILPGGQGTTLDSSRWHGDLGLGPIREGFLEMRPVLGLLKSGLVEGRSLERMDQGSGLG